MSVNSIMAAPILVKEKPVQGQGPSYVNIGEIRSLRQIAPNHWEAQGMTGVNPYNYNQPPVYHFDDTGARAILGESRLLYEGYMQQAGMNLNQVA